MQTVDVSPHQQQFVKDLDAARKGNKYLVVHYTRRHGKCALAEALQQEYRGVGQKVLARGDQSGRGLPYEKNSQCGESR